MKKYLFILLILPLAACHNSKKMQGDQPVASEQADGNMRFIVSFHSIGSGTNHEAIKRFDAFIPQFETKNKVKLAIQRTRWGKEGEIDYCFKLDELKAKQQEAFITETKELLEGAKWIRYEENSPCREGMKSITPATNFPKE
ncbi:MAG: hypothetical protein K0R65_1993 [Crocinitomicaceae bacterium]|jgi:hypothetical protein|nr:hypothetical protein [Crocinitomicaceae bacterium]